MNVLLISTYELGRQPFGLASPAAWLRREGCAVRCLDLSVETLPEPAVAGADLIAFHVPMHTATRLAVRAVERVRELNPRAQLCFYGLYAPLNEDLLRRLGAATILGGEFEQGLASLARRLATGAPGAAETGQAEPRVSLARQQFLVPERDGLPALDRYARLHVTAGDLRIVGYTEASRGCRHRCRHCPIVPVYDGRFRIVQPDVVLEDIRRQVARGARHVTFGDADFFNGPSHAMAIARALHAEFPDLSYDVTIKIEHLLLHRRHLAELRDTGCLFVTSAVEAVDDRILGYLDKGHTRAGFVEAVGLLRRAGLTLNPTFVSFTPWTTVAGYCELLATLVELELVDHVAPVQHAIRLLVTRASRLLELPAVRDLVGEFDEQRLVHPWVHPDPRVDRLFETVTDAVTDGQRRDEDRRAIFRRIWDLAHEARDGAVPGSVRLAARASVPYLTEPWYC